ncbi:MAG: aldehyde dehydrogenase family protein, partial [Gammaproteobacteria bacterium]|nr:aldehyde dehydrogenase family protein [Gammaproteobacteria bacterium]
MIGKELQHLGVQQHNKGCSTGKDWFSGGSTWCSFSPVDGKAIAHVEAALPADYELLVSKAQ